MDFYMSYIIVKILLDDTSRGKGRFSCIRIITSIHIKCFSPHSASEPSPHNEDHPPGARGPHYVDKELRANNI